MTTGAAAGARDEAVREACAEFERQGAWLAGRTEGTLRTIGHCLALAGRALASIERRLRLVEDLVRLDAAELNELARHVRRLEPGGHTTTQHHKDGPK